MAKEPTAKRRINRLKLARVQVAILFVVLIAFGFAIGKITTKPKVERVTVTETVETPVYDSDELPESIDVTYYDVPLSHSLQDYIYEVCADEDVPVSLVMAMIEHESQFDPEAISGTDDYGLMQINSINHGMLEEQYRCADMLNPYQNVFCGIKIIGQYLKQCGGDYNYALMSYNMGEYGATKAMENGITSTSYSETIIELMNEYEQEVQENATSSDSEK